MEISPIPGIRSLPMVKTPPADASISRVFDVENSSRPDDDTYSGSNKKGAGGQDDDNEDDEMVEEVEAPAEAQPTGSSNRGTQGQRDGVNFFA